MRSLGFFPVYPLFFSTLDSLERLSHNSGRSAESNPPTIMNLEVGRTLHGGL